MSTGYQGRALDTRFKGVQFRSRLEVRWAMFFEAMRIRWEYEPQLFELPSGRYLPDFRLTWPGHSLWAECKPTEDVLTARDKARYHDFGTNRVLLLLEGLPAARAYKNARALDQPGGIVLLGEGPRFVQTADGSPYDMELVKQAAKLACAAKFIRSTR